jgi:MFS family permease
MEQTLVPNPDALKLGKIGRWQIEKALLLGLSLTPLSWHYLSYPLLSAPKAFQCLTTTNSSSSVMIFNDNQCYTDNDRITPCQEWIFPDDGSLTLQEDFGLVCGHQWLLSLRQIIFFLGMLVGCLITGNLSDRYGRKQTMLVLMAVWSTSALLHVIVPNYTAFLVLQFILVSMKLNFPPFCSRPSPFKKGGKFKNYYT